MTEKEIIEKKIALVQNDIDHYNRRLVELENSICGLQIEKNRWQQKISKKHIYRNQLERDIEKLEDN